MAGRYFPLTEAKDAAEPELEGFLSDSDKPKMYPRGGSSKMTLRDKFATSLFVASCIFLGLSVWIHLHPKSPTDRQCVKQLNVPCMSRLKATDGFIVSYS